MKREKLSKVIQGKEREREKIKDFEIYIHIYKEKVKREEREGFFLN